jgi:hypothetical protein
MTRRKIIILILVILGVIIVLEFLYLVFPSYFFRQSKLSNENTSGNLTDEEVISRACNFWGSLGRAKNVDKVGSTGFYMIQLPCCDAPNYYMNQKGEVVYECGTFSTAGNPKECNKLGLLPYKRINCSDVSVNCDYLKIADDYDYNSALISCYNDLAIQNTDIKACDKIDNFLNKSSNQEVDFEDSKSYCYLNFIQSKEDQSLCDLINNEEIKNTCKSGFLEEAANLKKCEILTGKEKDDCFDNLYNDKAQKTGKVSYCSQIKSDFLKNLCLGDFEL